MWNFNKLLGICGLSVVSNQTSKDKIMFQLRQRRLTANCSTCGKKTNSFHSYSPVRKIKHGTILGKVCELVIKPRRFKCLTCSLVFTEIIDLFPAYQTATIKHKKEVVFNLSDRSFNAGTKRYSVSYHTQRKWLNEVVACEVLNFQKEAEEQTSFVLGIDEVSFAGRNMVTTIGNITKHRLKGVLHSKRKDELRKVLRSIPPQVKSLISEVVIDMCELYLKSVQAVLPDAAVVIDHFHVIQDANRRIDEERRILQDIFKKPIKRYVLTKNKEGLKYWEVLELEAVMEKYQELKMYWETKERLRTMYKSENREEAGEKLNLIISTLTSTDDGELITWGNTLSYWKEYILNYFNNKSTNGFMEGMHNKMKLIKRISFGFRNKEVFINKVMLSVLITAMLLPQLLT